MKNKKIHFISLFLVGLMGCSSPGQNTSDNDSTQNRAASNEAAESASGSDENGVGYVEGYSEMMPDWGPYHQSNLTVAFLKGTMGDDIKFSMHLQADYDAKSIKGYYFYDNVKAFLILEGTLQGQKWVVEEKNAAGKTTGRFEFADDVIFQQIKGVWKSPDGSKTYDFVAVFDGRESARIEPFAVKFDGTTQYESIYEYDIQLQVPPQEFGKNPEMLQFMLDKAFSQTECDGLTDCFSKYEEETTAQAASYDWNDSYTHTFEFYFNFFGIASFSETVSGYSGGAHGYDYQNFFLWDLQNDKPYTEDDLFKPGFQSTLTTILTRETEEDLETSLADYGYDSQEITPNGNIQLLGSTLVYHFNREEHGAYALPGINPVSIKLSEIKNIIREDGPLGSFVR